MNPGVSVRRFERSISGPAVRVPGDGGGTRGTSGSDLGCDPRAEPLRWRR